MKNNYLFKFFLLIFGVFFLLNVSNVSAASATIGANPTSATKYRNEAFDITIQVRSSSNFSVFRGNVSLNNLIIESFTNNAGDALWITSPSASSLNFNGAVKSAVGVSSINVYTIRVRAGNSGSASLNISNGRIVGVEPVEDFGVGYANGSYWILNRPAVQGGQVGGISTSITPTLTCFPSCIDRSCGMDGCGVSCGTCLTGFTCSAEFACIQDYITDNFILPEDTFPKVMGVTFDACKNYTNSTELANCNNCYTSCPTCTYNSTSGCITPSNNVGWYILIFVGFLTAGGIIIFFVYRKKKPSDKSEVGNELGGSSPPPPAQVPTE